MLEALLPFPIALGIYPGVLVLAVAFGLLTAITFTVWPLSRAHETPAVALFRGSRDSGCPTRAPGASHAGAHGRGGARRPGRGDRSQPVVRGVVHRRRRGGAARVPGCRGLGGGAGGPRGARVEPTPRGGRSIRRVGDRCSPSDEPSADRASGSYCRRRMRSFAARRVGPATHAARTRPAGAVERAAVRSPVPPAAARTADAHGGVESVSAGQRDRRHRALARPGADRARRGRPGGGEPAARDRGLAPRGRPRLLLRGGGGGSNRRADRSGRAHRRHRAVPVGAVPAGAHRAGERPRPGRGAGERRARMAHPGRPGPELRDRRPPTTRSSTASGGRRTTRGRPCSRWTST